MLKQELKIAGTRSRSLLRAGLLALFVALVLTPSTGAAAPEDAWVTTKIKMKLMASEGTERVNVDTNDGRVALFGPVVGEENRRKAEAIAKSVRGVGGVDNFIAVVKEKKRAAVVKDDQIKARVAKKLVSDKMLGKLDVRVTKVEQGVVNVSGRVPSMTAHLRTLAKVRAVPGVRRINSEVEFPDQLRDSEVWGKGRSKAGQDLRTASLVKLALLSSLEVVPFEIAVDVSQGHVTLFGSVPSKAARVAAEREAKRTTGVRQVKNALVVVSKQEEKVVKDDDALARAIMAALDEQPELRDVQVRVKAGIARLSGHVMSDWSRLDAARVVRKTPGVRAVRAEIQIKKAADVVKKS